MLASVDLNVKRVAERVSRGGHDISETVIRRRYRTVFTRFATAAGLAHECVVYDNSGLQPNLLIALQGAEVVTTHLDPSDPLHLRIAEMLARAHGVEPEALFRKRH